MRRLILPAVLGIFAGVAALAAPREDYKLEQREPVRHTFAKNATLDVDLVSGSVTVVGDGGSDIRVEGEKIMRAATTEQMERARREVVLDINEKNSVAQLYENGPFRDSRRESENHGFHERAENHYSVSFNLTVHAPRATVLHLHSVNGELKTRDTTGNFTLHTVNGAIDMTEIAGSGSAETLNGGATVTFRENPKEDSFFKSLNGRVDVKLQPALNAQLALKTFNGSVYTDFETTAVASQPETAEAKNGKFVLRTNRYRRLRVGTGGPELKFETFNGEIHIAKATR